MPKYSYQNKRAAKLTQSQVYDIRALYARGDATQGQLARDFHVSVIQIGRIVRGESWNDLPPQGIDIQARDDLAARLAKVQEEVNMPGMDKLEREAAKLDEHRKVGRDMLDDLEEE